MTVHAPAALAADSRVRLHLSGVAKTFTLHLQGGIQLPVLDRVTLTVKQGSCVILGGPSGTGKSSILKMVYGSYRVDQGAIWLRHSELSQPGCSTDLAGEESMIDLARAEPRTVLAARRTTMSYVSQFLRALPRTPAVDVVAEPLLARGVERAEARERGARLLKRLNIAPRLWQLPPSTFSGGEQQRVNLARGFVADAPLLLLDEPTASLDAGNREIVLDLIRERLAAGTAVLAIFHDLAREELADEIYDVSQASPKVKAS